MTSEAKTDLIITPATWSGQVDHLERTPTGLLHLVGWYGSTHALAMWRKAGEFLAIFREQQIFGFDPQIDDWDPSFAAIEAEVMAKASVIIIRLENNELMNGSLGSIAEIGMALTSAALRGQVVIVSIEDNLLTSLDEPGAIAQYMVLEMSLEHLAEAHDLAGFFRIHRGDDLAALAALACDVAQQQRATGQAPLSFEDFLDKRAKRRQNPLLRVVLSGSGGAYAAAYEKRFAAKRKSLSDPCLAKGYLVKDLAKGIFAQAWRIPYGSLDSIAIALAMRTLISMEIEYKQDGELLLMPIMSEAASKAAATWIGFSLVHALTNGQDVKIFLEPFDPVDFINHHLAEVRVAEDSDEQSVRQTLQKAGVPDNVLAIATREEVFETYKIIGAMARGEQSTFKQIKQSLLRQTEAFQNADNTRRVRTLMQAHLERLHSDARFPDFFYYSNQVA